MMCESEAIRHGRDNNGRGPINCHLIGFARIGCNHDIVTTMPRIKPFAPVSLTYRRRMLTVRRRLGLLAEVIPTPRAPPVPSGGQLMGYAAALSAGPELRLQAVAVLVWWHLRLAVFNAVRGGARSLAGSIPIRLRCDGSD